MKRFALAVALIGCGGFQHANDEPLTADQQQCMDQHTRVNAYSSMSEANRSKLDTTAQQALYAWVHDLSYDQCTNDEEAATKVLHRRTSVSLEITGSDVPADFAFDRASSRATGVVEVSQIPALAARPDVIRVMVEPKFEPS